MRRKLLRLYWLGVAVTLALGLFTVGTMVYFAISDTEKTLLSILSTASAWTEGSTENLPNLARQIAQSAPPLRVIFLLPQGIVLVDSAEATQVAMENMLAFPEIQGALQGLESSSIRLSGGVPTIYAARLLSDRLLIHLSFPLTDVTRLLWGYALGMAVLLCALLILLRRGLASFSRQMIAQLEQIQGLLSGETHLQEVKNGEIFYPELRPTMQSICYLIGRLHSDLASVRKAQDMRRDFAANASHELKSPLTSIQGFAEMLSEGMADSPEEQGVLLGLYFKGNPPHARGDRRHPAAGPGGARPERAARRCECARRGAGGGGRALRPVPQQKHFPFHGRGTHGALRGAGYLGNPL